MSNESIPFDNTGRHRTHHNFLFDLDQTLLDFHASEYKALGIVLRANGLSFSDEIYRAFKAYNQSLWLELEKGTITRKELFSKRFLDVFSRCEGDASGLDPLKVNDDFIRTMSVNGVLMDGALEFVRKLRESIPDARIYIASNGATINAKGRIASTGLDRYIDGFFISEDMGVTKPDAAFFEICLERIGEPKFSCIMIGDSLTSDMLGAKNASLDAVWFMPSGNIEEAMAAYEINYCASSFDELFEILKKWSSDTGIISFKQAAIDDAELLADIYNASFFSDYQRFGACPGYGKTIEMMEESIRLYPKHIILCDNKPVGCVSCRPGGPQEYEIGCLCVIPEYQGRGIGTQAVRFVQHYYDDWKRLTLVTPLYKHENVRFYTEKCGFKIISTERDGNVELARFLMERQI